MMANQFNYEYDSDDFTMQNHLPTATNDQHLQSYSDIKDSVPVLNIVRPLEPRLFIVVLWTHRKQNGP